MAETWDLPSIKPSVDTCVTALQLAESLRDWAAAQGSAFPQKHTMVFALSSAFISPWLDRPVLELASRIWSWITAVDDTVDSPECDHASADAILRGCRAVAAGGPHGDEPLARALAEIRDTVAALPGHPDVAPLWRDAVDRLLVGMAYEARSESGTLTGYLEHATYTVGVPMYVVALWAAMERVDPVPLLPALRDAAVAVRLANDARGHAREAAEGGLNALRLGLSPDTVRHLVGDRLASCERRLAPLLARADPPAVALHRMAVWGTRIYQRIDFRYPEGEGPHRTDWKTIEWPAPLGAS
ncbi:terpene synthase family protein [Micromonospora sp. CPCC 206061]|uniref:terpene synthase family protein n=1 Tax=Micromonospora sp. CPCC 206061 TaxID=3122410 RepID=UPI002FEEDDCC